MLKTSLFFDLKDVWFAPFFEPMLSPWQALEPKRKEKFIESAIRPNASQIIRKDGFVTHTQTFPCEGGEFTVEVGAFIVGENIEFKNGVKVESSAWVTGPTIFGENTTVRHGAYVRGGVITGKGAVIGHTSEIKSSILMNHAKAAHFAYVGDSILGSHVNLGAGTKISNLKITQDEIVLRIEGQNVPTGLRKMGAIVGDGSETGCNSVLNPGVLLGMGCMVYPATAVKNKYYSEKSIIR